MNTLDQRKQQADILIEYANGGSFTIKVQSPPIDLGSKRGIKQIYDNGTIEVATKKLAILEAVYKVEPNF